MKKLIFTCLILVCGIVCFGHSGRTDKKGGHFDRNNGGYHYHHGKPPHQHTLGNCPYRKNDNWVLYLLGAGALAYGVQIAVDKLKK